MGSRLDIDLVFDGGTMAIVFDTLDRGAFVHVGDQPASDKDVKINWGGVAVKSRARGVSGPGRGRAAARRLRDLRRRLRPPRRRRAAGRRGHHRSPRHGQHRVPVPHRRAELHVRCGVGRAGRIVRPAPAGRRRVGRLPDAARQGVHAVRGDGLRGHRDRRSRRQRRCDGVVRRGVEADGVPRVRRIGDGRSQAADPARQGAARSAQAGRRQEQRVRLAEAARHDRVQPRALLGARQPLPRLRGSKTGPARWRPSRAPSSRPARPASSRFSVKTAAVRKAAWRKQGGSFTAKALVTAEVVSNGEAVLVTRTVTLRATAAAAKKAKLPGS